MVMVGFAVLMVSVMVESTFKSKLVKKNPASF